MGLKYCPRADLYSDDNKSVPDFETTSRHHVVMVSQEHCCDSICTSQMPFLSPNQQNRKTKGYEIMQVTEISQPAASSQDLAARGNTV